MRVWHDLLAAFTFLTRIPMPRHSEDCTTLARASKFFPLVGFVVAAVAYLPYWLLDNHAGVQVRCVLTLCVLVLITGGFHEDALADTADGFGGGWTRERVLEIMRDSRVGSYGALAVSLSVLLRFVLLSNVNKEHFWSYLASAQILCRWSTLPLSFLLPAARREDSKSTLLANRISRPSLVIGTAIAVFICLPVLKLSFVAPLFAAISIVLLSAAYYRHRIGGITGDCFGATNQIVEIATYLCGVLR